MLGKRIYFSCLRQPVSTGMCHTPTQCEVCTNDDWYSDLSPSLSLCSSSTALDYCSVIIARISLSVKRANRLLSAKSFVGPLTKTVDK